MVINGVSGKNIPHRDYFSDKWQAQLNKPAAADVDINTIKSQSAAMASFIILALQPAADPKALQAARDIVFKKRPVTDGNDPADVRELVKLAGEIYKNIGYGPAEKTVELTSRMKAKITAMIKSSSSISPGHASERAAQILKILQDR